MNNLTGTIQDKMLEINVNLQAAGPQGIQGKDGERGPKGDTGEVTQQEFDDLKDQVALDKEDYATHKHPSLLSEYTYNGNIVVNVTNLDVETGIFTAPNHGLTNNMSVSITLNDDVPIHYKNTLPNPLQTGWRRVVNSTTHTFQISASAGGIPITYISNPEIDYSKWHLEAIQNVVTSINISNFKPSRRVVARYKCKSHVQDGNIFSVLPSFMDKLSGSYYLDSDLGLVSGWLTPVLGDYGHSQLLMWGEVEFNVRDDYFTMALDLFRTNLATVSNPLSNLTVRKYNRTFWSNDPITLGEDITDMKMTFGGHMMLNGSSLEVYSLD